MPATTPRGIGCRLLHPVFIAEIRGLLGDEKLNYLGWSYGTWLGVWYPRRNARLLERCTGQPRTARQGAQCRELARSAARLALEPAGTYADPARAQELMDRLKSAIGPAGAAR